MTLQPRHLPPLLAAARLEPGDAGTRWGIWRAGANATAAERELAAEQLVMLTLDRDRDRRHLCITAAGLVALAALHPAARQAA